MNSNRVQNKKTKKRLWLIVPIALFVVGVYALITILAPAFPPNTGSEAALRKQLSDSKRAPKEDRLYIPAIGVDVAIVRGDTEAVLEKGAWHRRPNSGDPEKGGNFVLSAHRFEMGMTPQQTRAKSPFYHIDKLQNGDEITVDYNKKRYTYEITKKYHVNRLAVEIEDPSDTAKMTLYSCDLRGEAAGREVIEATPRAVANP